MDQGLLKEVPKWVTNPLLMAVCSDPLEGSNLAWGRALTPEPDLACVIRCSG